MQGGQHQMAGIGIGQRRTHGLARADLAHHDHVRGLAHPLLQGMVVARGIDPHLALTDDGTLVREQELDGVLDREDVPALVGVAVVDHRRQRGRLPGTGSADDQDQPVVVGHKLLEHVGQPELLDGRDGDPDKADDHRDLAALAIDIHAKAPQTLARQAEVDGRLAFEDLGLMLAHHLARDAFGLTRRQRLARDGLQHPVDLDAGRCAGQKEQVGGGLLRHQLQVGLDLQLAHVFCFPND